MSLARVAIAGLLRAPGKTLTRVVVLAAAVALLGSMLLFIGNSLRTMTTSATRSAPLHWQGPVGSYDQARRVASGIAHERGILQASATATAPFAGATHSGAVGATAAGGGSVLAVAPDYLRHIRTFHVLRGSLKPGSVVLDQQLAATLRASMGERIGIKPSATAPVRSYKVSGVASVTASDVLFAPLNPQLGPAPAQPPANVAIMPVDTFARTYAPALPGIQAASPGASAVPGAQQGIQWEVQAQLDTRGLGHSPAQALTREGHVRNRVERTFPGQVQFVDNLSDRLNTATSDALYAEALYIMLAVPGAVVALGLAYLAALGTVERERRDLALLRARGARRRDLLGLAGVESVLLGLVAGLVGAGGALLAVSTLVGAVDLPPLRALVSGAICVALAIVGAASAKLASTARVLRAQVAETRRSVRRQSKPLWQLLYLDLVALAISGLVYWLTASTGFSAVVNPDSNPTLSLSVYMLLAPAMLWIGATLLLVRLRGRALAWVAREATNGRLGGRASALPAYLLASAGRRGAAINRGLVVVGLLLAFGVNLGIFSATYDQQAKVDAQLTLGADVVASAPPGVAAERHLASKIAAVPGVKATTALDHSYAYVGPDLQDVYGIDAPTLTRATSLRDSYFIGDSAGAAMARLHKRPDGVLVSKETITDYSLARGDLLKLRVLDHRSGHFAIVPFHVVGTVQEFPSAPKDSFMVANRSYLESVDHAGGPNAVFAKANGSPPAVARRVARATKQDGTQVKNIREQTAQTVSSITTVDLSGISKIEEAFASVLAAAAMGLFVALALSERRHEFATMAAVGASQRDIRAFLWSEAAIVLGAGLVLAAGLGWLLSKMMVAMLQHVFDPPPDQLAIPWGFLGGLAGAALAGTTLAAVLAALAVRRLSLGAILRER